MLKEAFTFRLILVITISSVFTACNFFEDAYPPPQKPPQTKILEIKIIPNDTLAPGDTATFHCIIADTLDNRFVYTWGIDKRDGTDLIETDTNSIKWIAPENSTDYTHNVTVNNGSEDSTSVSKQFNVSVMK